MLVCLKLFYKEERDKGEIYYPIHIRRNDISELVKSPCFKLMRGEGRYLDLVQCYVRSALAAMLYRLRVRYGYEERVISAIRSQITKGPEALMHWLELHHCVNLTEDEECRAAFLGLLDEILEGELELEIISR